MIFFIEKYCLVLNDSLMWIDVYAWFLSENVFSIFVVLVEILKYFKYLEV